MAFLKTQSRKNHQLVPRNNNLRSRILSVTEWLETCEELLGLRQRPLKNPPVLLWNFASIVSSSFADSYSLCKSETWTISKWLCGDDSCCSIKVSMIQVYQTSRWHDFQILHKSFLIGFLTSLIDPSSQFENGKERSSFKYVTKKTILTIQPLTKTSSSSQMSFYSIGRTG